MGKKTSRKILALFMTLAMVMSFVPAMTLTASASAVDLSQFDIKNYSGNDTQSSSWEGIILTVCDKSNGAPVAGYNDSEQRKALAIYSDSESCPYVDYATFGLVSGGSFKVNSLEIMPDKIPSDIKIYALDKNNQIIDGSEVIKCNVSNVSNEVQRTIDLSANTHYSSIYKLKIVVPDAYWIYKLDIDVAPPAPTLTSATYDADTGVLAVTGIGMTTNDSITVNKLTLTGESGNTYQLTSGNVTPSSATNFSVTLNALDRLNVNGILNKSGTASAGGTNYNLAGAEGWDVTQSAPADTTNGITVSNLSAPAITSATYNVATGVLTVTGTNFVHQVGANNDIDVTKLAIKGQGGGTSTLTSNTSNVEITSATSFTVTLGATDKAAINSLLNNNGTSAMGGTPYNLAAADDWNGPITDGNISDLTNAIAVSGVNAAPTVTTPAAVSYTDTAASDTFPNKTGTITASDSDGTIASYGISGGTTGGNKTIGSVTYDVFKSGKYGTLYVKSSTGEYAFVPNDTEINAVSANQSETFSVTATDNGGASGTATLAVNITGANDTPTVGTNAGVTVTEGSANTVIAQANLEVTDVDTTATSITYTLTAVPANGTLYYDASPLAIDGTFTQADINNNKIKYTHDGSETTSDSFSFTVSDGTGGSSIFTVTVTNVNDAPVLDNTSSMMLTSVTEDVSDPVGNTVAAIIASAGGDRITDADSGALEGIAVTALSGDGAWQYNTGNGWNGIGAVLGTSALLLRNEDSLRFVPTASYNNAQTATITFRAWDQTSGTQGNKVDASTNGGTTAFSLAAATASIAVTAVNDNPAITGLPAAVTVTENTASNVDLSASTFSDPDSGSNSVTLKLTVNSGTLSATAGAVTVDGSGTATLTITGTAADINTYLNNASNIKYTGVAGTFGNNAATLTLTANDGGNTGTGGGANVTIGTVNINITALAPTVTNVTSSKNDGTYGLGETIDITVEFSHDVVVDTTGGKPQLTLETGAIDRTASYTGGSGSNALTFTYTTQVGDETSDLNYKAADSLVLNSGTIKRGTTNAVLTLPATTGAGSLGANKNLAIAAYPTVTLSVDNTSIAENGGASTITATIPVISSQDVVVSLAYSGTATGGTDYNATASGTITIPAGSLSASAAVGITATQDIATEGNETIIIDIAGVTKGVENGVQQQTITILDDDIPTVTNVTSSTANGSYKAGDTISIQVTFSTVVTVTGTPQLLLETGTTDRTIDYVSGSGTAKLTFSYTVQSGDNSADLNYLGTDSLMLNGGTITNSGQPASIVLPDLSSANALMGNKAIVVDTTAPNAPSTPDMTSATDTGASNTDSITNNTTPTFIGTAEEGSTVRLYDTDGTTVLGSATATGGNWSITTSALGAGTHTITAKATDAAGNVSASSAGLVVTIDTSEPNAPLTLDLAAGSDSGSSSADNLTNDITPTFTGMAEDGSTVRLYDTDGTTVLGSATATGGNWSITASALGVGTHTITTKATDVAGNVGAASSGLEITIDTSAPSAPLAPDLTSGSDSGSLTNDDITNDTTPTFTGTAEANSSVTLYDTDGTTELGSATTDGSGNWSITSSALAAGDHALTVKAADAAGNESASSAGLAVTIDTTEPTVRSINRQTSVDELTNETSVVFQVTFSESVTGVDISNFTLTKTGTASGTIASVSASNGTTISVTVNSVSGVGTLRLDLNASGTNIMDEAENAIASGYASGQTYTVDLSPPTVTITSTAPSSTNTLPIPVTITFSENVMDFAVGDLTVENGTAGHFVAVSGTVYTADITPIAQGPVTVDVVANVAQDAAGNKNTIATRLGRSYDTTAPTVVNGGTIAGSELTSSTAKLTWMAATDMQTVGTNLQYKVVYSLRDNISSVSDAETNGTTFGGWTSSITSITVTGLTASKDYYFNVLVKDEAGNKSVYKPITQKTLAEHSSGGSSASTLTPSPTSTVVEVNGQKQDAGTVKTQTIAGQTFTTITVDDGKLNKILESKGENPTVTLPTNTTSGVVAGELSGQTVKNMEKKEAVLEIKTGTVSYTLPASQINIDAVSSQLGSQVELKDIRVSVKIAEPSVDTVKVVENTAKKNSYQIVVKPMDFEISCTSGGKTVSVSQFNGYVERTVAIPDGVDPSKITTGIVLNTDGTFRHVPTNIIKVSGKYYAKINSLTNSTYSVIWNPVTFADVANHWAKDAVNDMGSRMVVTGVSKSTYEPDRSITRAEFTAIVVRALGLAQGTKESSFGDVSQGEWFNGYVDTATSYALITGYDSKTFAPNDTITREQAMAIIARAMKLTGMDVSFRDSEATDLLSRYTDSEQISAYAKESATVCLKAGVVNGTTNSTISAKSFVTRAEVSVMVKRLLQESGLI